ncbi:Bax inhibitor-1/YccA family protein [Shimazuella kribbensis]|uniref:Bax inhibitor-1/YccA family protein n=1 Tax=Shimazuella kribbensis TaxID=139808 RepID=UPI0004055BB2|nr:Bax inhibitor-1/YccA family protein [Shimazuella kribbensis]
MGPQYYQSSSSAVKTDQRLFQRVFSWMFAGLLLTGIIAYFLSSNTDIASMIVFNPGILWGAIIVEIIIVLAISALIGRISAFTATFLFFLYAALNGITFTVILAYVDISTVGSAFIITAGMFGISAALGYLTKADLSKMGSILLMFVIGILLASVVNIFFIQSSGFDLILSYIIVAVFCGITAYDVQNIKRLSHSIQSMDQNTATKVAIFGALMLYIDFIAILQSLINIFNRD